MGTLGGSAVKDNAESKARWTGPHKEGLSREGKLSARSQGEVFWCIMEGRGWSGHRPIGMGRCGAEYLQRLLHQRTAELQWLGLAASLPSPDFEGWGSGLLRRLTAPPPPPRTPLQVVVQGPIPRKRTTVGGGCLKQLRVTPGALCTRGRVGGGGKTAHNSLFVWPSIFLSDLPLHSPESL